MKQVVKKIKLSELHLWTENPRDPINVNYTDEQIIRRAISEYPQKWNLDRMLESMGVRYDMSEIPTVVIERGRNIIYDGNRRIATIKCIQNLSLYQAVTGNLNWAKNPPSELLELSEVYCNVCDKNTALDNIERKHINNSSWGTLERDFFMHNFRGQPKSDFIFIEEATGIISRNLKVLNQRYVKEEVFTKENLNEVGLSIIDGKLFYNEDVDIRELLQEIIEVVSGEYITTRKNRKKLLLAIREHNPNYARNLHPFDINKSKKEYVSNDIEKTPIAPNQKRTYKTRQNDILFGKKLFLQKGKVNDLYLSIDKIYNSSINDDSILPIIGMSLRLLLEVAAREHFIRNNGEIKNDDNKTIYKDFIKLAKKDLMDDKENFITIMHSWINCDFNMDAILSKYAHAQISYERGNILQVSYIVGNILEKYFGKRN